MLGTEDASLNYLPGNNFVCLFSALWPPLAFFSKCALLQDRIFSPGAAPAGSVVTQDRGAFSERSPRSPGAHTARATSPSQR